ncbi:hypothetical protein ABK905_05500 [Acerihabitans sp. KWT182]|uniref:Uncharacterized protein n=1 Tax=Acerihabitans sp. KWT182 TaxID=3157919 RepID=A0AAU7QBL1_9GAMM
MTSTANPADNQLSTGTLYWDAIQNAFDYSTSSSAIADGTLTLRDPDA